MKKFLKKVKSLFWGDEKVRGGSALLIGLIVLSTVALLVSNILAGKSFSLFGWSINGAPLVLTCGVILFPINYILSDIFSNNFSYSVSRRVSWINFAANLFLDLFIILGILIPGANPYYNMVSDGLKAGFGFDFLDGGQSLGSLGILFASLIAFIVGSLVDDLVFEVLRKKHKGDNSTGKFVIRAVGSSFAGEVVDSLIFIPLLYLFTKQMGTTITNFWQLMAIVGIQAGIKTLYELLVSPFTAFLSRKIQKYEEKHLNDKHIIRE